MLSDGLEGVVPPSRSETVPTNGSPSMLAPMGPLSRGGTVLRLFPAYDWHRFLRAASIWSRNSAKQCQGTAPEMLTAAAIADFEVCCWRRAGHVLELLGFARFPE